MAKRKPLHIIFIPGLGDKPTAQSFRLQQRAVKAWRSYGVSTELVAMQWGDPDETWQQKLDRLALAIDVAAGSGKAVGLVGASAGALAAITAYEEHTHQVVGVVTIAGKINRPEAVGDRYKQANPALMAAIASCQLALSKLEPEQRSRIMSRRGLYDELVRKSDNYVPGARNRVVLGLSHAGTIAAQLTVGAPSIVRFLKRQID